MIFVRPEVISTGGVTAHNVAACFMLTVKTLIQTFLTSHTHLLASFLPSVLLLHHFPQLQPSYHGHGADTFQHGAPS